MFVQRRNRNLVQAAFTTLALIYHQTVHTLRQTHANAVIGILIMSVLTNGLRIMSIPQEWQSIAVGVVILVAVYIDIVRKRP